MSSRSLLALAARRAALAAPRRGACARAAWPEHEYLARARAALDAVYEGALAAGEADAFGAEWDAESDGGVVRLQLGRAGGYVLNTQTPNRQIWLSSPLSGPWRYEWDAERAEWRATRDGHRLFDRMEEELAGIARGGVRVSIKEEDPV